MTGHRRGRWLARAELLQRDWVEGLADQVMGIRPEGRVQRLLDALANSDYEAAAPSRHPSRTRVDLLIAPTASDPRGDNE